MKKIFFLLFLLSWGAYAESNIQCITSGYIDLDQNKIYYGANTYIRYDGECRPLKELNRNTWTYQYKKNRDNYEVCKINKCILLPVNKYVKYNFGFDKISISYQYNNISNITDSKSNCKEIILGYSDNWKRKNYQWESDYFIWDDIVNIVPRKIKKEKELHICENITNKHGLFIIKDNYLIYQICKEDIKKDSNKYLFEFNSFIISGANINGTWGDGVYDNTTEKYTTNQLQLNWSNLNDILGFWNFDREFGSCAIDQMQINNGSLIDYDYVSGKYNKALDLSLSTARVELSPDDFKNQVFSFTGWIFLNGGGISQIIYFFPTAINAYGGSMNINIANKIGTNYFGAIDWDVDIYTSNSIQLSTWEFVAIKYNSTHKCVRLNFECVCNVRGEGDINYGSKNATFGINAYDLSSDPLNGYIDDFRYYDNKFLNVDELNSIMYNEHYYTGLYKSDNITAMDDKVFLNISINYIKNNGNIDSSYFYNNEWHLISKNIINNKTYNISYTNVTSILLNFSVDNSTYTSIINEIILGCGSITTTTIPIQKHKYYKGDLVIQRTNSFIDKLNMKFLIIIGLILMVMFFMSYANHKNE